MVLTEQENIRFDLRMIARAIPEGSRVLDLGCGNGDLLAWLAANKQVVGTGIEKDKKKAAACIGRGLSVLQGDLNDEVDDYPDCSFDYVILSQTLQQVFEPSASRTSAITTSGCSSCGTGWRRKTINCPIPGTTRPTSG